MARVSRSQNLTRMESRSKIPSFLKRQQISTEKIMRSMSLKTYSRVSTKFSSTETSMMWRKTKYPQI